MPIPSRLQRQSPPRLTRAARTILLAEDDPSNRKVLQAVLEHAGYNVVPAADGNTALRLSQERGGGIDLLLTDLVLPGINGVDLIRLIQAQSPRTKVMLLSGQIKETLLREERLDIPFLAKPVTNDILVKAIREILRGHNAASA
jgi:CheY-like chemotaxis protein